MSSTTRSIVLLGEALQRLFAVACLDDPIAVPLERIREQLLNRVLVVDEQNGGGFGHRREGSSGVGSLPRRTIAPVVAASDSSGRGGQRAPRKARPQRKAACQARFRRAADQRPARAGSVAPRARPAAPARVHDRPARAVSCPTLPPLLRRPGGGGARDRAGARLSPAPPGSARRRRRGASGSGASSRLYGLTAPRTPGGRRSGARPRRAPQPRHRRAAARPTTPSSSRPSRHTGVGPGANDNASGTAALIELARGYGRARHGGRPPEPQHTLMFLSSDGGAYGGFGAERFASTSPYRDRIKAVVSLEGSRAARGRGSCSRASSRARPRQRWSGPPPSRSPRSRRPPARPGWLVQLVDLGIPFGYGEQAPFLGRKISAIRARDGPRQRRGAAADTPGALDRPVFSGSAGPPSRSWRRSTAASSSREARRGYVYLGSRVIRGWAIELVLLDGRSIPFLVGAIDLFARSRRRRLPLPEGGGPADAVRHLALDRRSRRDRRARRAVPAWIGDPAAARTALRSATGPLPVWPSSGCSRPSGGGAPAGCSSPSRPRAMTPCWPATPSHSLRSGCRRSRPH